MKAQVAVPARIEDAGPRTADAFTPDPVGLARPASDPVVRVSDFVEGARKTHQMGRTEDEGRRTEDEG